jgi:hypothetical protein
MGNYNVREWFGGLTGSKNSLEPYYWQHMCPTRGNNSPPVSGKEKVKETKTTIVRGLESLQNMKCGDPRCEYEVTDETVLLNRRGWEIRKLGGEDLFPYRFEHGRMRCCGCGSQKFETHDSESVYDNPDGLFKKKHDCDHAREYKKALNGGQLTTRLEGCSCSMLSSDGEVLGLWVPIGGLDPTKGGSWERHQQHLNRRQAKFERDQVSSITTGWIES